LGEDVYEASMSWKRLILTEELALEEPGCRLRKSTNCEGEQGPCGQGTTLAACRGEKVTPCNQKWMN